MRKPATLPEDGAFELPVRLPSRLLVMALARLVNDQGGAATILHSGDPDRGAIVLLCQNRGSAGQTLEYTPDFSGEYRLVPITALFEASPETITAYCERRLKSDPDLWLVELDIAEAERFAAQIMTKR